MTEFCSAFMEQPQVKFLGSWVAFLQRVTWRSQLSSSFGPAIPAGIVFICIVQAGLQINHGKGKRIQGSWFLSYTGDDLQGWLSLTPHWPKLSFRATRNCKGTSVMLFLPGEVPGSVSTFLPSKKRRRDFDGWSEDFVTGNRPEEILPLTDKINATRSQSQQIFIKCLLCVCSFSLHV